MEFDRFTAALLVLRRDAPELGEQAESELQDAHMAFLADLHEAGYLLAAGPLLGAPDREFRGLSIFRVGPERALELHEADPAVRAGRYTLLVFPWIVPGGVMSFSTAPLPRSMEEANA